MSSPFDSNPVDVSTCAVNNTFPAMAHNGGTLQAVYADTGANNTGNNINITSNQISKFIQNRTGLGDWTAPVKLATLFPGAKTLKFQTPSAPAIVALGEYNYIFWSDASGQLAAVRCHPDGTNAQVATSIAITPNGNQPALNATSAVAGQTFISSLGSLMASNPAAIAVPEGTAISLQFLVKSTQAYTQDVVQNGTAMQSTTPSGASFWVHCTLPTSDFEPFGTWNGTYAVSIIDTSGAMAKNFNVISAAWFTQGEPLNPASPADLIYYLVVAGYSHASKNAVSYAWQVNGSCQPPPIVTQTNSGDVSDQFAPLPQNIQAVSGFSTATNTVSRGVVVTRDPSGALAACYCQYDKTNSVAYVSLMTFNPNMNSAQTTGLNAPGWTNGQVNQSVVSMSRPAPVFAGLPLQHGQQMALTGANGQPLTVEGVTLQRLVMLTLTTAVSSSGNPPFQLQIFSSLYGTLVCEPQANRLIPSSRDLVLAAIADTFPYPNPATGTTTGWNASSPSGTVDWTGCQYEYLVGNQAETEVTLNTTGSISLMTAGSLYTGIEAVVASARAGVKWQASLTVGAEYIFSNLTTHYNATVQSVSSKGVGLPDGSSLGIRPVGALFGRGYPALLQAVCVLVDRNNKVQWGNGFPVSLFLYPASDNVPSQTSADFPAYCYTPGNLLTYNEETINATMNQSFNALTSGAQADFTIDGHDYSYCYAPNAYVASIVEKLGAKCFGPQNESYLEFTFGSAGSQRAVFQDTSQFTHAGALFANASAYATAFANAEVKVLVVGAGSLEVTAGFEVGVRLGGKTSTTSTWGISLASYLNPLAEGESYTVRMYFLKPSRLWARELQHFAFGAASPPPAIDFANSAPVRFLFTVPYISPTLMTRLMSATYPPNQSSASISAPIASTSS